MATEKTGLSAAEKVVRAGIEGLVGPTHGLLPIPAARAAGPVEIVPRASGNFDHLWAQTTGSYAVLSGLPSGEISMAGFQRNYTVLRALEGLARAVPNFPFAHKGSLVASSGGEGLVLHVSGPPVGATKFSDLLFRGTELQILSVFAQVVCATAYAHSTLRFAHNTLDPTNVAISPYAPFFVLNYERHAVLCTGLLAVVTNFHRSQASFVDDQGRVRETLPCPGAINLRTDPSSDLYRFTRETARLAGVAAKDRPDSAAAKVVPVLKKVGEYYVGSAARGPPETWHTNIEPWGTPAGFIEHMRAAIKEGAGAQIIRGAPPHYGNVHIKFPPADTWNLLSIHSLVALGPPPSLEDLPPPDAPPTKDAWLGPMVSRAPHDALAGLVTGAPITAPLLEAARAETPGVAWVPQRFHDIARSDAGRDAYRGVVADAIDTPLLNGAGGPTTIMSHLRAAGGGSSGPSSTGAGS